MYPDTGGVSDRLGLTPSGEMGSQGAMGQQQLWRCHSSLAGYKGGVLAVLKGTGALAGICLPMSGNCS